MIGRTTPAPLVVRTWARVKTLGVEDLGSTDMGTPDTVTVFDVYRELRDALRESPDHRTERARRLVEAGDAEALFAFVRDEILLIPDDVNRFVDGGASIRWGTRATLRGGAGTAREKSELLAELLRDAGFEARVLRGPWERPADTRAMFLRARDLPAFYVEAAMPSNSMWLDDVLTAKLDMEPFFSAASSGSTEEALAAYEAGLRHLPAEPFAVQPSLRAAVSPEVFVYETEPASTASSIGPCRRRPQPPHLGSVFRWRGWRFSGLPATC